MEKKYELLKDDTINVEGHILYRIKALRNFNYIKIGDLGGYIEKEDNLSHENDCWAYDNARVYGNAKICDNAKICNNAMVYGNAKVSGNAGVYENARVYDNAKVWGYAMVCNNSKVYGNASVYDNVRLCDSAMVYGDADISDNARVYDNAKVCGIARVYDNARLYDNAIVNGDDAVICGNAILFKDAYITNTNDYILIGPIGSRNAITTFYLTKNKTIMVKCGCFNDTIDKFVEKVNETHKDNPIHLSQYVCSIDFAKSFLSK